MATAKAKLLQMPGFSSGVRANAAVRMVKLGRPICPNSKLKMIKDEQGKWVPAEHQEQNCQLLDIDQWWVFCKEQGHDPYFRNRVWYELQDIVEEYTNEETGEVYEIVTGQRRVKHVERTPNIAQVSLSIRQNSGRGVEFKMQRHGFVRLADLGYEEVCQFRNCQKPLTAAGKGGKFGNYCSKEHLALIAADADGIMLHYPTQQLNGEEFDKVRRARDKQLREALTYAQ